MSDKIPDLPLLEELLKLINNLEKPNLDRDNLPDTLDYCSVGNCKIRLLPGTGVACKYASTVGYRYKSALCHALPDPKSCQYHKFARNKYNL